ncbi:hypothetical protein A4A49_65615, partial [Nicotiana attenuata]
MEHEDLFLLNTTDTTEAGVGSNKGMLPDHASDHNTDQADQAISSQEHGVISESKTSILASGEMTQEEPPDHMPHALPEPITDPSVIQPNDQLPQTAPTADPPMSQPVPSVALRRSARGVKPAIWMKDYYTPGNS